MATYVNDLRLTELATGEGSGTWGTTTNTNLELIGEALGFGTQDCFGSDADATTTVADGSTDPARSMFFKVTSSATLSATRTLTIAPNTLSRVMIIENATTGSQSINISQGSGANVTIANGNAKIVYLDGAGSGAAVVDALIDLELTGAAAGSFTTLTASDDVNFDSGTLFVDASANEVGIGTTSPQSLMDVSATNPILTLTSTRASNSEGDSLGVIKFFNTDGNNNGPNNAALIEAVAATSSGSDADLLIKTIRGSSEGDDATEALRVTYEGNFLVSTTNTSPVGNNVVGVGLFPNGSGQFSRDGGVGLLVNRKSDDGDIASFRKDGTEVGVVGSKSGDLIIGTGTTGQRFLDGDPSISPVTTNGGTLNDNTIDLGRGTGRWKDLYLGGGLYVGGTGSANFLDDYEEGTWSPVVADATSGGNTGSATIDRSDYTKIGRQVTVSTRIRNINTSGMTSSNILYVRDLPFTSKSSGIAIGSVKVNGVNFQSGTDCICQIGPSATFLNFVFQGDDISETNLDVSDIASGTSDITLTLTYFAA